MPFDGNGLFSPAAPEYPAVSGTVILADDWNTIVEDLSQGLSNALTRDGQSPAQANIPMGGFKLTGLAAGSGAGHSLRWEQIFGPTGFVAVDGTSATTQPFTDSSTKLATTAFARGVANFAGDTPPPNPFHGLSWLNTLNGREYVYIDDGTSAQWVEAGSMTYFSDPLNFASVAELQAYEGGYKVAFLSGYQDAGGTLPISGTYIRDPSDAVTADDGLNTIVDGLGRRWKRCEHSIVKFKEATIRGSEGTLRLASNAYYSGGNWKYADAGAASCVEFTAGGVIFYNAVVGVTNAVITWVKTAEIDTNGHFKPGVTGTQDLGVVGLVWKDLNLQGVSFASGHQGGSTTFALLPAPAAGNKGCRRYITDCNLAWAAANFGAIVAGGAANFAPVTSDGVNWRMG